MSAPPRIGIVCPRYAPAIGGVERHVEMLVRGLAERGYAVEIITTDPPGHFASLEERDGVLVRRFPTVAHDAVFFVSPRLHWWLHRNAGRYALLHAHSYHTPLAFGAAFAARNARVPFVFTPHYHGTGHSRFRTWLHRPYRPIGAWMLHRATRVICVSAMEQGLLAEHFGADVRTVVIPNGVDLRRLAVSPSAIEHPCGRVLSVGRLDHYKQADRIAKALPYLPRSYRVTILGDGPARVSIQQLAAHPTPRLCLPGQVSEAELVESYRSADVFVTMSREESFGMTILEAAAAGAPVVASDIPAHREVASYLAPGRVVFVDRDCTPMALADTIQQAVALGRAASVEQWRLPTWNGAADALVDVYRAAGVPPIHPRAARLAS